MSDKLTINLKGVGNNAIKTSNSKVTEIPEDYIEIIQRYMKIYHGCWIKYTSKESNLSYPGGYLIQVTDENTLILRNIRRDVFELEMSKYYFYCKKDTPHHEAVKNIIEEKDRFSLKVEAFNVEKQKFLEKQIAIFTTKNT